MDNTFPKDIPHPKAAPMKTQGIKTKLVGHLGESFRWDGKGRFIEPFAGSCSVAINLRPDRVLACDINPHAIRLMKDIRDGNLTPKSVKDFLLREGELLSQKGVEHYLALRRRFNLHGNPHDFLFLNRSGFNGLVRFNRKGELNVPFCKKPDRFSKSYITKIANLVENASNAMKNSQWEFAVQSWEKTLLSAKKNDFVYLDPPYTARHADYYTSWTDADSDSLASTVKSLECPWAYSMWLKNRHRTNTHLLEHFSGYPANVIKHAYHVGAKESMRSEVSEAIVICPGSETGICQPLFDNI